ncbi:haloacid dehalogenase type II [Georgenia deserti]|uniref:Haloacid dehalogenase type II n=1 Tax=Georgenia deserti TaxID=2093781 RepID=A0ABW4KZ73_9MICO
MTSTPLIRRPALVFDILGTLIDQAGSLRDRLREATGLDANSATRAAARWLDVVADHERAINNGSRPFAPSHVLDREAVDHLVRTDAIPASAAEALADTSERLNPWPDSVAGIDRLARMRPVLGLSNAGRRTLSGLSAHTGLRWHQVLSAEDAAAYKPDPAVYATAMAAVPADSGTPIMVAAHAWDLRAAATAGMRTAYVPRPDGDPPRPGERFDLHAADLADLADQLQRLDQASGFGGPVS